MNSNFWAPLRRKPYSCLLAKKALASKKYLVLPPQPLVLALQPARILGHLEWVSVGARRRRPSSPNPTGCRGRIRARAPPRRTWSPISCTAPTAFCLNSACTWEMAFPSCPPFPRFRPSCRNGNPLVNRILGADSLPLLEPLLQPVLGQREGLRGERRRVRPPQPPRAGAARRLSPGASTPCCRRGYDRLSALARARDGRPTPGGARRGPGGDARCRRHTIQKNASTKSKTSVAYRRRICKQEMMT